MDNIQRAQSDVCIYRSEILEFKNLSYDPVAAAIDLISGLTILVDAAGYNGSYLLYDDSGMIMNAAEAVRKRILTATYQSLITGEEVLDRAEKIIWYFPLEGSMIYPPQLGTEYSQYELYSELTEEEITALELPCKYCRIERAIPEVLEGDAGDEITRQTEQVFRIKDYYTQTATNNTIYCAVFKNGREYKAEASLTFGISGTCGTDATFLLQMMEWDEENNIPTTHPVSALTIGKSVAIVPKFYDYNNNDITDEYLSVHTITYNWYTSESNGQGALQRADGMTNPKWTRLYVDSGAGIDKCQYYILSASVYWSIVKYKKDEWGRTVLDEMGQPVIDEEAKDLETRDVQLKTFLTIPVRTSDEYTQVVGPTQIVYNKDGTNAAYYNAPFVLYKNGEKIEARWMLSCKEYLDSGSDSASRDSRILNYYPSLDSETGKLTPKEMFLSDGKPLAVEAIVDGEVVWTQPILIIKNKYSSAMLNAWDGEMCIDQENGTIMSTMVGAGKKDVNNTFTGVLMGDVMAGAGFDERNHKGIGIYGFHQGAQSFGFNVDGTAFIGKAGRGRICMDGNKGTIQSGSYERFIAGMQIDLDGVDSLSASLRAYGPGGSFELDTDSSGPLFEIRSGPEADAGKLIHIGNQKNQDFYIQSWDYNKDNKIGTRLDLETGIYETYSDANNSGESSYIRISPDGNSGYFVIHDKARVDDHIFYCSPTTFYLQSVNYVENDAGMKIDLRNGTIDARKGYIGGWEITKSTIQAGNIILDKEGSMKGGPEGNTWYIDKNGNASFNNLSASLGNIGPFDVSDDGLSYKGSLFTLGKDGLNLNDVFTVDLEGKAHFHGYVYFENGSNIEWQGNGSMGENGLLYSGSSYGSGPWGFSNNGGFIGPWIIDKDSIHTEGEHSSWLGATGEIRLDNGVTHLKLTNDGLDLGNTNTQAIFWSDYISLKSNNGRLWLGNATYTQLAFGDGNYITIKDGDITLKSSKIVIDGDLYPSNGQGSEKGWTGNVVFVDGSSLKFQNGILVGGQVADLVTMS